MSDKSPEQQLEVLQAEIERLRRKTKRRSFKQALTDMHDKALYILNKEDELTLEESIIAAFLFMSMAITFIGAIVAIIAAVIITKGLLLLLVPVYPIYLLLKKEENDHYE
jgi:VIT1/CCC1 family predicted Fe2+/Mn2+ transporter